MLGRGSFFAISKSQHHLLRSGSNNVVSSKVEMPFNQRRNLEFRAPSEAEKAKIEADTKKRKGNIRNYGKTQKRKRKSSSNRT